MNYFIVISILFTISTAAAADHKPAIPKTFIISGPGVTNKYSLPVQYFYIQPVDETGEK